MLSPRERTLLLQSLRPPEGFRLDRAIGTSFSLDLLALLTAPLAFTFFDWEDVDGRPSADPLALLEAVRRHADRITLFCQSGGIHVPHKPQALIAWIERCVVEVRAPDPEGIFHPKVWVLRFTGPEQRSRYRLLCLSRNLTFDRSWDTALVLDGEPRGRASARNRPLSEFIAALPAMAVQPMSEVHAEQVRAMASDLQNVHFELPTGFEEIAFFPRGLQVARGRRPPFQSRGLVVVSPFLSAGFLEELAVDRRGPCTIISRPDELQRMPQSVLSRFEGQFCLAPDADPEGEDENSEPDADRLVGLHAKLFIEDDGWNAHVWTGSANATNAAFERNVEFLVRLSGKKSQCGTEAFLDGGGPGKRGFRELLDPWQRVAVEPDPAQLRMEAVDTELDRLARTLACRGYRAHVSESPEGFTVGIVGSDDTVPLPAQVSARLWPTTIRREQSRPLATVGGAPVVFPNLGFESLTCFFAFELTWKEPGLERSRRFVLKLPTSGLPADRNDRLLRTLLRNREQVLRLLWLLLSSEGFTTEQVSELTRMGEGSTGSRADSPAPPLLESMLRALELDPDRLDEVERLVNDLSRTEEGRALLPEGFDAIWRPIAAARKSLAT